MSRVHVLVVGCTLVACAGLTAGCSTYWGQRPLDQPAPVNPNYPVWIWSRGAVDKWHAVLVTQDSISGIPYEMPQTCDSCRRSLPRTQVDSMKASYLGHHITAGSVIKGVGFAAAVLTADFLFEYVLCSVLPRNSCSD